CKGFHRVQGEEGAELAARVQPGQAAGLRRGHRCQPDPPAVGRVTDVLTTVRARLTEQFARIGITGEPAAASVTFLGTERYEILRFGPSPEGVSHYVSLGCSRHPMGDPDALVTDPVRGPRAEVVVALKGPTPAGLARSVAVLAAAPAVEGLILEPDALVDLGQPLWD